MQPLGSQWQNCVRGEVGWGLILGRTVTASYCWDIGPNSKGIDFWGRHSWGGHRWAYNHPKFLPTPVAWLAAPKQRTVGPGLL